MELFVSFKFLHIVTMFFAVALAISGEIVIRRVASSGDPVAIRTVVSRVKPLSGHGSTAFFGLGVVFGVAAALAGQINLLAPWLIISYVAFVLATALGVLVADPWVERLEAAAADADGDGGAQLRTVIADPTARAATWALMGLIVVLVFAMVVKPLA